jgi:hypothetical protein
MTVSAVTFLRNVKSRKRYDPKTVSGEKKFGARLKKNSASGSSLETNLSIDIMSPIANF